MTKSAAESPQNEQVRESSSRKHGNASQSLLTQASVSLSTLCDYRNKTCAAYGVMVGGKWICNNHICEQRQRCWLAAVSQPQITVAQVRAAIFDVLDERRWLFDQQMFVTVLWTEDDANGHRHLFADRVIQRLTELRERGLG